MVNQLVSIPLHFGIKLSHKLFAPQVHCSLMRVVLSSMTAAMLRNDRSKDAFFSALFSHSTKRPDPLSHHEPPPSPRPPSPSPTSPPTTTPVPTDLSTKSPAGTSFRPNVWHAPKALLDPLWELVLRIEPSPSCSTIVVLFDMLFDDLQVHVHERQQPYHCKPQPSSQILSQISLLQIE